MLLIRTFFIESYKKYSKMSKQELESELENLSNLKYPTNGAIQKKRAVQALLDDFKLFDL